MHILPRQPSDAAPARIRPLSVLPVFYDLAGRRAVVAGGSAAAAWKAELIAAAGADLHVYAQREGRCEELVRLAEREPGVMLHDRDWRAGDLADAVLAVADAEDEAEAGRFRHAARAAGAACNVIDKPAFCDFQFGAIVNRSPAVIGISTAGAAPIIGQAIRRRIETLLPPSLAEWTALARDWREKVNERLAMGAPRRAFWERFADRAFGAEPPEKADIGAMIREGGASREGHVTFVGAGPGDAELLTLKAMRALQAADVILFDDLVSDAVLELARREARRILVGKRAGRPSCKQYEINDMMVALAKAGRRVVRLKSGDPMIFGRAGEEIEALRAAGIGFDVVPGITAGLAMASTLGVSLTHRDRAKSVRFVTGHSKKGGLPDDVDWAAIADPSATTIFYMGARMAGEIAAALVARGMEPATPVAIAADLARPTERLGRTDLAGLAQALSTFDADQAILIGVGSVFEQRAAVDAACRKVA